MALISIVYRCSNRRFISSSGLAKQNQRLSYVSYRLVVFYCSRQLDTLTSLAMAAPSTGVTYYCWHGDTPWGSNLERGGYQFRILLDLPSCLRQPGHFLISILPVIVLNNAWLEASSMAVGDGTPGATANSGGPARSQPCSKVFADSWNKLREVCYQDEKSKGLFERQRNDLVEEGLQFAKATYEEMGIFLVVERTVRRKKIMPGDEAADEPLTLDQELKRPMLERIDSFQHEIVHVEKAWKIGLQS
ncbi:hypothetical protein AVEN_213567-1 [Araneus ventricosus]|uniref:Uncharacterized protein n=1 Tax=Araneus ventricosus TaxID=182803 RepID=A0A4Y2JMJ6_ARAVE|nr:hypothetical protein AVEN_213567-1 [Araneus ventricosus]